MTTPIGRVSNFRKRSVMKNSVLNILGNSDVLIPIRDNTPFEIKPIIGSPRITDTTITLLSHQGMLLAFFSHALNLPTPRIVIPTSQSNLCDVLRNPGP